MKTVGLITEYNPFHNGHLYHIERARELTGADRVVIVMSGDYVQRGTPALLSKHSRAHMALLNGASAICELPVCYASGSAEFFAQGAISILEGLGCIDTLCFGSECGELSVLQHIRIHDLFNRLGFTAGQQFFYVNLPDQMTLFCYITGINRLPVETNLSYF